jgi:hypothetical protein
MKKPRTPVVTIELREDVHINWNKEDRCFELLNSKGEISKKHLVSIGEGYEREKKGPKILRQLMNRIGGKIDFGATEIFFDRYLSIDTSYKVYGENFICVAASISIEQALDHKNGLTKGDTIGVRTLPRLCFLCKPGTNPERYGWKRMIDAFVRWDGFNPMFSYGIVVDSELGILPKINARELPVFEDFFLPPNISLIYASADAGQESFFNKLIRAADRVAAISLETALQLYPDHERITLDGTCGDLTVITYHIDITLQLCQSFPPMVLLITEDEKQTNTSVFSY